ncbi:MAG: cysteine desulfhydrase [Hyphomicrobiales bacterium]|nr:MAG: cysteine desulfhydrase [Hyphomicrobiales bacterium]
MSSPTAFGKLDTLPRHRLGHAPTPIDTLANLSKRFGARTLLMKRDDCTGLGFGGNKVRQLEFYLGEAGARGADTVLITGAVQSNFVRVAAAAARVCGMECHIQLEERVPMSGEAYRNSGNVLLDVVLGATLYSYPDGEDEAGADRRLGTIAAELNAQGRTPYIIPLAPGHAPLGALGYVVMAAELLDQIAASGQPIDEIVVATGSGHTHGGLLFGLRALGSRIPVTGVCVRRAADLQRPRIAARCQEIADLLGVANPVSDDDIQIIDDFLAPGYGRLNAPVVEAIRTAAETEGLFLDPVYTGRTMAGFLKRAGEIEDGKTIMMVHTGGTPALFAYGPELTAALGRKQGD